MNKLRKVFVSTVVAGSALVTAAGTYAAEPVRRAVLPIVGSVRGAFDSNFKTEVQLNNRSAQPMSGRLVFHPMGRSAGPNDPYIPYSLEPHQTLQYDDVVLAMAQTGLGSIDVIADDKGVPTIVARAYDDKGNAGTTGATIPPVRVEDALLTGESSTLLVPSDRQRFRFNIGIRTLEAGATVDVEIYNENGVKRKTTTLTFPHDYFVQQSGDAFVTDTLTANEAVAFIVRNGSAIVYGTTTDNSTNDPSVQLAPKPLPVAN
jgi:hypothetical protein